MGEERRISLIITMLNSLENREVILNYFPKLIGDSSFKITSPKSPDYNCIAWAGFVDNEWWQPGNDYEIDGVKFRWPPNIPKENKLKHYIELFRQKKFILDSNDSFFEDGFRKVALYVKNDQHNNALPLLDRICTHASRQLNNGTWTSKLGQEFDISHSDPYVIESKYYGIVGVILKKIHI